MPKPDQPWFVSAFGADYLALYAHRSDTEARTQIDGLLAAGLLPKKGRVLDLCCGAGRHLKVLRAAGINAWGLDLSMDLLRAGKLGGQAVRADMRRIAFADASFSAVVSLFTSFGYFDDDAVHLAVLSEIHRVLAARGKVVLDIINAGPTVAALKGETTETTPEGDLRARRRHEGNRIIKEIELKPAKGPVRRWHESVRVFEPSELDVLLSKAGLKTVARYADLAATPFIEAQSPRQVVIAVK